MRYLLLCSLLQICTLVVGQSHNYLPAVFQQHQVISYDEFTLSYNEQHEQADWVAYEITAQEANLSRDRCGKFKPDNQVSTGSASLNDYKGSGFDRGHLSPAAANNISENANCESFLLSNMSPQLSSFNSGIWKNLEEHIRNQAKRHNKVYVVSGPVFKNNLGTIGENQVTIPGYFYKVLLCYVDGKPKTIGFLIPHVGAVGEIEDYAVNINTIESITGIDFFPLLGSQSNRYESNFSKKVWGL